MSMHPQGKCISSQIYSSFITDGPCCRRKSYSTCGSLLLCRLAPLISCCATLSLKKYEAMFILARESAKQFVESKL